MSAVTQWFDKPVTPVHVGLYEVNTDFGIRYSYWDGSLFGYFSRTSEKALELKELMPEAAHVALTWRGLAVKP